MEFNFHINMRNGPYLKMVGRGQPSMSITAENFKSLSETNLITGRSGDKFRQKCTIGTPLWCNNTQTEGVHLTHACIPGDAVVETGDSILEFFQNSELAEKVELEPVCFTVFGPTVVIFRFNNETDEQLARRLDKCGMSESKILGPGERLFHVSVPVKVDLIDTDNRNYTKAFDDVSDEKFKFWTSILDGLEYAEPNDRELLKMSSRIA